MSAKISASRKKAFLKAIGETGNITVSAERAKVSRGWVLKERKGDPEFEAAFEQAKAQALRRLGAHGSRRPPSGWRTHEGMELVVRGTGGSGGGKRVQIARARLHQWDSRTEDRFLAVLAATCNAKAAYTAAGMSNGSAYGHRKRWPGFAKRWDEAIEEGTVWLEFAVLQHALNPFSSAERPGPAAMPPPGGEEALHMLHMNKRRLFGRGGRPGRIGRPPPAERVREKIIRGIETIEQAKARGWEWERRGSRGGGAG